MTTPARAADPAAPTTPVAPSHEPVTCSEARPDVNTGKALEQIAYLANELCEHLTDDQWRLAAQIRDLAESARPTAGAS
ncbi:hypothetical protein J2Z21_008379 [Streptomyces griseochromogenes]|uniref:Uncharacterized protein n=1 Tax=Streptomyces griseochromogenes TaxID=68214 RepID=A0A1B1B417_9ACTN|nr:hypothetical protein [Streptomyces griseochromogenes]ANP53565.1 hypothetical protein AVL59_32065 [Streptomyces griseochromogenes]MBP2055365.1 hypothetical protein [Streptomyces griseochromogenes]